MDNQLAQFIKKAKHILLSKEEKASMRARLEQFANSRAVREGAESRLPSTENQKSILTTLLKLKTMPILAVLVALTLAGGGVSAAAEASLPGDLLYSVKVKGTEEVRAFIALSSEAKAEWEARRAERRLEEAEQLAARGEISAEAKVQIEENFKAHAERVNARIAEFNEKNDFEAMANVSSRFETSLDAHERILERLAMDKMKVRIEVSELKKKTRETADRFMKHREDAEKKLKEEKGERVEEAAKGKMKAAENKIEEVEKFISRVEERLGAASTTEANAKLETAEEVFAEGEVKFEAGAYGEAFNLFQKALRIAEEAKLVLNADLQLKIDLRSDKNEDNSTSTAKRKDDEAREKDDDTEDDGETIDLDIESEVEIEVEL